MIGNDENFHDRKVMNMSVWTGYIHFEIALSSSVAASKSAPSPAQQQRPTDETQQLDLCRPRKRQRRVEKQQQQHDVDPDIDEATTRETVQSASTVPFAGYVFIRSRTNMRNDPNGDRDLIRITEEDEAETTTDDVDGSDNTEKYLLSVPYELRRVVADACRHDCPVQLSNFSICKIASNGNKILALLEVQHLTLAIPTVLSTPALPYSLMEHDKTLTLYEVFQEEAQYRRDIHKGYVAEDSTGPAVPNLYTFRGTVRARSPILSLPKKNDQSFILVEIVDDKETYRCIVVIRQEALSVAEYGIAVNDEIDWVQVPRRKWRVREYIGPIAHHHQQHPLNEIPSQAFVVEHVNQIQWYRKSIPTKQISNHFSNQNVLCNHGRPVQGIIEQVHWIHLDDKTGIQKQRIHWLQMKHLEETKDHEDESGLSSRKDTQIRRRKNRQTITAWFVTYFPMSSSLQLSLRPGAKLWGFHLHKIASDSYCACLHSNIVLVEHSTTTQTPKPLLSSTGAACLSLPLDPYEVTTKIRKPYSEWVCRRWVAGLLSEMKNNVEDPSALELPSLDVATAQILSGLHPNNTFVYSKKRNVYAEFFDCHENMHLDEDECELPSDHVNRFSRTRDTTSGCHVSRFELSGGAPMHLPRPVSLTDIQELAFQTLEQRIKDYTRKESANPIPIGWTASIRLFEDEISQFLGGDSEECNNFYTLGYNQHGEVENATGNMVTSVLSNGRVEMPVVLDMASTNNVSTKNNGIRKGIVIMDATKGGNRNEFMWARISSVAVSCICFRRKAHNNSEPRKQTILKLPTISKIGIPVSEEKMCTGPCALLVTEDGYCFFVALFLVCDRFSPVDQLIPPVQNSVRDNADQLQKTSPTTLICSVAECLGSNIGNKKSDNEIRSTNESSKFAPTTFISLLVRSSFKPYRVKNGTYKDYYITISQAPFTSLNPIAIPDELDDTKKITCTQSIEFKPHVSIDESMCKTLQCLMASFVDNGQNQSYTGNLGDQLGLCVAWWKLATCGRTCALLGGGWDEASGPGIKTAATFGTIVQIPTRVLLRDKKHGYVRIRCTSDDIAASVFTFSQCKSCEPSRWDKNSNFDFIGGKKFIEGSLEQRPLRRQYDMAHGELLVEPVANGVPTVSLADLFTKLCTALKSGSAENISPSLVVRIRGAEFLGVSYCRAIAECSKCYATLRDPSLRKSENTRKKSNMNTNVPATLCMQRSFWHLPLPSTSIETNIQIAPENDISLLNSRWTSSLVCPNSCPVDEFGTVKWECSGTLDDGTAQARLYAERQTALCLLGLSQSSIKLIEKAAWLNQDGVVFSKTMIPKSDVRKAILSARTQAQNYLQVHKNVKSLNDDDVMAFLTPKFRAEYLMQAHCRFSTLPLRKQNYLIRVKPVSKEISMLEQTAVEINRENIATYTLPAFSLKLVDCATSIINAYPDDWNPFS
jgi:hypothetical protein